MTRKILFLTMCGLMLASFALDARETPWKRGQGEFSFTQYAPLKRKPVLVRYYIPEKGDLDTMRVVVALHGSSRNGEGTYGSWYDFAKRHGFIVIAPEFEKELYPEIDYQFGSVYYALGDTKPLPREKWTYNLIEAIFDDFLSGTQAKIATYDLWGHSAGAQFVHRLLLAMPEARVGTAVAANAGSWTYPLTEGLTAASGKVYGWAFSVKGTPFGDRENLAKFFARDLVISLGTADIITTTSDFPKYESAMAQGGTRLERGHNFYNCAKQVAVEMGLPFNWRLIECEGIAHTGIGMTYGATVEVGGKKTYSADHYSPNGGFGILFPKK